MTARGMVVLNPVDIVVPESGKDAFGRLRVSFPYTLLDSAFHYDVLPSLWDTLVVGTGSVAHDPNTSSISMNCGTDIGDRVVRQSRMYLPYKAGKSQLALFSVVFGEGVLGVTRRCGYYDDLNGIFLELDGTTWNIVLRSYATGSVVETRIPQSSWNKDTMDGAGVSGVSLDPTRIQILSIDFQWLGAGRIRVALESEVGPIICHELDHSNILTTVFMSSGNLPVRYEILVTGALGAPASMSQVCSSVISEGGAFDNNPKLANATTTNFTSAVNVGTTPAPILSVRLKALFNGHINRGFVLPHESHVLLVGAGIGYWELRRNATLTGDTIWTDVGSNSLVESNLNATAVVGGETLASGFITSAGTGGHAYGEDGNFVLIPSFIARNISNSGGDTLTLVARSIGSDITLHGSLLWVEHF